MQTSRPSVPVLVLTTVMLFVVVGAAGFGLWIWKQRQGEQAAAAAQQQPEPMETVEGAVAAQQQHARQRTTIGTVRARQSITLRNELPGTVQQVLLQAGQVVEPGALLVEFDTRVETAELQAAEAEARLSASYLARVEQALQSQGASAADVDRARAEHDKAKANVLRLQAVIDRKRVRAPFRAMVGMVDLHPGQYLDPGTTITTLQGVDDAVHIEFAVTQETAAVLRLGQEVKITAGDRELVAKLVAIDAEAKSTTRNTWVRALLQGVQPLPQPGSSVRVAVPVESPREVVTVPVSALRKGPAGDHVFVLAPVEGKLRASERRVRAGQVLGDVVVIAEGVQVGERVAAAGSFKLREHVLVNDTTLPQKQ